MDRVHKIDGVNSLRVEKDSTSDLDPFTRLLIAVIKQAAMDYKMGYKRKLQGQHLTAEENKNFKDAENYLASNEYREIIDVDGNYIMERIREELNENKERTA